MKRPTYIDKPTKLHKLENISKTKIHLQNALKTKSKQRALQIAKSLRINLHV